LSNTKELSIIEVNKLLTFTGYAEIGEQILAWIPFYSILVFFG